MAMSDGILETLGRLVRSPAFKFFLIGALVLLLVIPLLFVWALIDERQSRSMQVIGEVGGSWGGAQRLDGPVLVVPYSVRVAVLQDGKEVTQVQERRAVFMPEALVVEAEAKSEVLHRSIYQVPVYRARLAISGRFAAPVVGEVAADVVAVRWQDAILALGISDVAGLKTVARLVVPGRGEVDFSPSIGVSASSMRGIHARLAAIDGLLPAGGGVAPQPFDFRLDLSLSGSTYLRFSPVARETSITVDSDWRNPSFTGAFLPASREVSEAGFKAAWSVPHLARSVPQAWGMTEQDFSLDRIAPYAFGVDFYVPVDFYDLVSRAVKYGLMFPAITFMAVFVMELASRRRVHPVQYLFVGIALVFFLVLLLSFSEHIGFGPAYLLAALATSGMLALYAARALRSRRLGLAMLGLLLILYGLMYLILRLEDYALLAGSIAGFAMLTAAMFLTLGVDWSGGRREDGAPGGTASI